MIYHEGLEFLPEHSDNYSILNGKCTKKMELKQKEVSEAKYIETDFSSKRQEKNRKKENLISAF